MNNVNEGWRSVRALMLLTGLALCASAFAADPTPAAAGQSQRRMRPLPQRLRARLTPPPTTAPRRCVFW
ncbi:hypothetical protein [Escherichia coli]|uniref:hypothetical protein n=1 Tax=Escherichia coli TaxID=562 RepID=UPI00201AE067|nr:hypothetical protein [Escherichia coli]